MYFISTALANIAGAGRNENSMFFNLPCDLSFLRFFYKFGISIFEKDLYIKVIVQDQQSTFFSIVKLAFMILYNFEFS